VIRWSSRKSPISSIHGFAFDHDVHASGFLALGAPLFLLLFIHLLHVPVDELPDCTLFLWTTVFPERCAPILYPQAPRETLGTVCLFSLSVHISDHLVKPECIDLFDRRLESLILPQTVHDPVSPQFSQGSGSFYGVLSDRAMAVPARLSPSLDYQVLVSSSDC